ncbi:MAG: YhbY family RNA-binding protein [Planctomycetota bacterium JB042]
MIELTGAQRRWLRSRAQTMKPTVRLGGEGVTETARAEVLAALDRTELLKVRLHAGRDRKADAAMLAEATGSALAGLVGRVALLYRPSPAGPLLELPSAGDDAPDDPVTDA